MSNSGGDAPIPDLSETVTKPRKRANDLDGRDWTKWSISVWDDIRKTTEETRLGHPAIFPTMLVSRLIQCFTRSDERVILDPFAGIGSTVLAARDLGRDGVGIELSEDFAQIAGRRLEMKQSRLFEEDQDGTGKIIVGDSRQLSSYVSDESVDMVVTSPPYWDVLERRRTADYKETRNYGSEEADLGKIGDYDAFINELAEVFRQVHKALKPEKYCVVIVMDLRKKDQFFPLHSDVARMMQEIGFKFDDLFIWNRAPEYNNLRSLGYPSVFRVNKVHEYCLIFQKKV